MFSFYRPQFLATQYTLTNFIIQKYIFIKLPFPEKTDSETQSRFKIDSLNTEDFWQYSHFYFEKANDILTNRVPLIYANLQKNDADLKSNGERPALSYFETAQQHWKTVRDNECYSDTYLLGPASIRYMVFLDCMTRITKNRLDELTRHDADE
ncbi:hypothetical protein CI15_15595 [Paraburkholderia monticola]|uniref:Lysozyme inhibitor LprI-like N-terminal domain-containing protein n=1 Tax=Paraburkholderia monticola TaxID=1399968 RepID=A0A149PRB2_9BURK|nr:hypothetical protein CI15_15595 [Paraburkholderia monticola]